MLVTIAIEFTPALIEIVDGFIFRQSIQGKGKPTQHGA
jgi:hypothetical protein